MHIHFISVLLCSGGGAHCIFSIYPPIFIFVIVLALLACGGCVYPRHPSRLIISFSRSDSSHIFAPAFSAAAFSAAAFSAAAFSAAAFSDKRKPLPKTVFPAPLWLSSTRIKAQSSARIFNDCPYFAMRHIRPSFPSGRQAPFSP